MAKTKNRINKKNTRRKQQKAVHYKSNQRAEKHLAWNQPNHLNHYDDLPIEYDSESDHDPFEKPSLTHLDLDDIELEPMTNRFSVLDSPPDDSNTMSFDADPDDCFFFDETPADITFDRPAIIINSKTKQQPASRSSAPDMQPLATSKRTRKKNKQHKKVQKAKKVQTGKKVIPGDDIYIDISSDEAGVMDTMEDMTYTFQEECALDQDFIENTDPETWQQLQQWATQRSVLDEQPFDNDDDDDDDDEGLGLEDQHDDPVAEFGLDDSDEDEYIQQYAAHQHHQQQMAQRMQTTISNTLAYLPPSLHTGMHGFLEHNRRYAARQSKSIRADVKDLDTYSGQLRRLDRRIQLFVSDPSRQRYQLHEMTLHCRQLVQGLAKFYHIKVSSDEMKEQKLPLLLEKCPKTQSPKDRRSVEKYINKAQLPERTKRRMERKSGIRRIASTRTYQGRQRSEGRSAMPHAEHGTVVGSAAAPLASSNMGHKMLAKMGWKEGEALGTNKDGIAAPIQAVIRDRRRGLGA